MLMLRSQQRIILAFHAALCVVGTGCQRDGSFEMKDTEGRAFSVTCTEKAGCIVASSNGAKRKAAPALTLRTDRRVLGVCERDGPPITCRPLLCEDDTDCPTVDGVFRSCG